MVCSNLVMTRSPEIPDSKETDINATTEHYLLCVSRDNTRIYIPYAYSLDLSKILLL
jgi:hypothetical protein